VTDRPEPISRTTFLRRAGGLFAVGLLDRSGAAGLFPQAGGLEHPEPREGITAERVLTADALGSSRASKVAEAYEAARTWPAVFDGIACGCSCGGKRGMHRSLLVCFETMQPTGCGACQLEAELVARLARQDKPLADIRKAVDKEFS
jgi:hypothetical protein